MDSIIVPALIGLYIEAVVYYVDTLIVKKSFDWRLIAALVASVMATTSFGLDVFAEAGFLTAVPFVGSVFTGVLFSRFANLSHNVIERIRK